MKESVSIALTGSEQLGRTLDILDILKKRGYSLGTNYDWHYDLREEHVVITFTDVDPKLITWVMLLCQNK